jgi:hypothetical protein
VSRPDEPTRLMESAALFAEWLELMRKAKAAPAMLIAMTIEGDRAGQPVLSTTLPDALTAAVLRQVAARLDSGETESVGKNRPCTCPRCLESN